MKQAVHFIILSNLLLSINAADIVEILNLLMAGNLVQCTYVQKTKMLHIHRNNFLNGLHAPNFIVQYKIIFHSYFIKLHDNIKPDLCPEKSTSIKVRLVEYKFITSFIYLGISILSDVHFQISSTQNRQNT